ncbi:hypothetical protein JCM33374_g2550 [Metschnikowia sp. JCM 33374]|nr:hypothetical protein JCM33374_g2550 [Metschnikowia sp. JCM 33374]
MALPESQKRDSPSPLKLDFTVSKNVGNSTAKEFWSKYRAQQNKRDGYPVNAYNYRDVAYHVDVYLGSNGQKNSVMLDTGSADLWVPNTGYNPSTSDTSSDLGEPFSIWYADGSESQGEYYSDSLSFANGAFVVENFQFARAGSSTGNFGTGVLGIADTNQEASQNTYDNLPYALQSAGITPKASYSLFLGPKGDSGTIIFGGIDTEKYTGNLATYNIDTNAGGLAVDIQSVNFNGKDIPVNAPALLDSGTTLGFLNKKLMNELDVIFKTTITTLGSSQYRLTSCVQPSDKFLKFNFGANTISIPYSEAIGNPVGNGLCYLGFGYNGNQMYLGDVFLRKAYVYYDLTDQTISLAQSSYSSASNIISA